MSDIVKRLRAAARHPYMDNTCKVRTYDALEAADEIEKLRAERDLWISRFEDFRKNAARLEEARSRPMRLVGNASSHRIEGDGR